MRGTSQWLKDRPHPPSLLLLCLLLSQLRPLWNSSTLVRLWTLTGGEPIPILANPEPPAVLDEVIAPPVHTPSPDPHPRPPSPVGIGARLPMRNRQKPREWWRLSPVQLDDPDQTRLTAVLQLYPGCYTQP